MALPKKLKERLENLPTGPGVYLMKDAKGSILYVGKGKNLRKRVLSYFRGKEHQYPKTRVLVSKVSDLEFILTGSEKEALILESNLIKRHRPRYNVVLRDDKRYLVLRLDPKEDYPRLSLVRRIRKDDAIYFGPYASAQAVRQTLKVLHGMFPLRQCSGRKFKKRQRPCLNHQMGRCLGLCAGTVAPEEYAPVVEEAVLFLKGRTQDLQSRLREEMHLNDPFPVQYYHWLKNLVRGDLGDSSYTRRPVTTDLIQYLPATFELILFATLISAIVGQVTGVLAGYFRNSWFDGASRLVSYLGIATPSFVVAIFLLFIFSQVLKLAPGVGRLPIMISDIPGTGRQ